MVTAGDFNAKVSVKDEKYSADSKNGELMLSTLNDIDLSLLNYESKWRGKWTRVSYEKEKK